MEEFSEDRDPESGDIIPTIRSYPTCEEDALLKKPFLNVPWKLRSLYSEVMDTYNIGSTTLCAAGIRAVIEGICADKGIRRGPVERKNPNGDVIFRREGTLEGRINGLYEGRIITQLLKESLHEHRYLGNDALHTLQPPDRKRLAIAIELLEHTLDHVYEVADRLALLKARKRPSRGVPTRT